MTTFVVSLFLPYTVNFQDAPEPSPRPSPHRLQSRSGSVTEIQGLASLFLGPTTPLSSLEQSKNEFLTRFGLDGSDNPQKHFPKASDPRSLLRSDAQAPEWGAAPFFNQPKSRAGPLPTSSILEYAKAKEQFDRATRQESRRRGGSLKSRPGSNDRAFQGKTWSVEPAVQGNGGLTNAVRATFDTDTGSEKIWVGTLGFPTDALADSTKDEIHDRLENEYEALTVYLLDRDFDGHYAHYCKVMLWPVFHYQIPDHPKSKAYEDHSWKYYRALNLSFADKVIAAYKHGDIIWVHDYHLLLVPDMVRQKLPDAQIGLFLHTAFPSSEVFRCLSTRNQLLEGMLGADLVSFQTREYAQHFLQTCSRLLTVEATSDGVQLEDRFVNVTFQPIGIDPAAMNEAREESEVKEWIEVMQDKYKGKLLIVARDKLDHVRGIRQKLLAYELFLNKYPEWREKVVLLQVATSSTENNELLATVSDICTRIDAVHSTLAHQPLVFLKQDISFSQYIALLTVADVLMITALREGMNLTAHEFVFCQDGTKSNKKHGPVIVSEFTGCAAVFGGSDLSINPWDYQACARQIKTALEMDAKEKERRYNKLRSVVMHHTGGYWASQILENLAKVHAEHFSRNAMSIPRLSIAALSEKYKAADRRIFILDYEGTLASYGTDKNMVLTSAQRVLDTLNEVLADRRNTVYVMSSCKPEVIQRLFYQVPLLGLIAENGCFLREYGASENDWIAFADLDKVDAWKQDVKAVLKHYAERIEGSWIEERHCSLVFHYEKAEDLDTARAQAGECVNHINDSCGSHRVHAVPIDHTLLIETIDWSKASAATHILDRLREQNVASRDQKMADFLMVAGDDREDEVIFRWANGLGDLGIIKNVTTVSMGKRNTEAQTTLTQGTTGLLSALSKLAKLSQADSESDYFGHKSPARKDSLEA